MFLISTSRGLRMLALVVLMAATGLAMLLAAAPTTNAQAGRSATIKQVTLTPGEEVPAVTANAIGYFSGTLTDGNLEFDLSAVAPEITMAHIHAGAKGANGPVVAFLYGPVDPGVGAIHPTGDIKVANLSGPHAGNWKAFTDAMAKGELYVNVHSKANPGGVVRAQIPATTLVPGAPSAGDSLIPGGGNGFTHVAGVALVLASVVTLAFGVSRRRA